MIGSSNTSSKKRVRIGLLGLYGWGNLGDAAIQEATMQNLRLRIENPEFVGLSLNPADTETRHGIEAYPITSGWERFLEYRRESHGKLSSDRSATAEPGSLGWYSNLKGRLDRMTIIRFPYAIARSVWHAFFKVGTELKFIGLVLHRVRNFDLLVFSGGGLLDEYWGGPWHHPFTVFRWALAAKLAGTRSVVLSVGASIVESRTTRLLLKHALRFCDYRSVRDPDSYRLVRELGVPEPVHLFPDLAFSLKCPAAQASLAQSRRSRIVGLSPIAWMDPRSWPEKNTLRYQQYVETISDAITRFTELSYQVKIFASDVHMDYCVIEDISMLLGISPTGQRGRIETYRVSELAQLLEIISGCDIVVAARLHGVLLSYLMNKPVLGLSCDKKVDHLMKDVDQMEYCLKIDEISPEQIVSLGETMFHNRTSLAAQIEARVADRRELLSRQYDDIVSLLACTGSKRSPDGQA